VIKLLLLTITSQCAAQTLHFGLIGGFAPTDAYPGKIIPVSIPGPDAPLGVRYFSQNKDWLAGGLVEIRFGRKWAVEADGMYRELHMTSVGVSHDGTLNSISFAPIVTWEFPILLKRRFQWRIVQPFVEAGPSFRTTGNLNAFPSHYGFTAGAGVEKSFHGLNIAPVVRYTRWAADPDLFDNPARSSQNQVELLVAFSPSLETSMHPFGKRVSLGALAGATLTPDYWTLATDYRELNSFTFNGTTYTTFSRSGAHSTISGPTVEIALGRFGVEFDAIYRVYRQYFRTTASDGRSGAQQTRKVATWEFPVLAKYRVGAIGGVRPFVEAGPSFRIPGTVGRVGVTGGAGIEMRSHHLHFSPALRYTYWFDERSGTQQNAVHALLGVSF